MPKRKSNAAILCPGASPGTTVKKFFVKGFEREINAAF
jgi:hypothetical protein